MPVSAKIYKRLLRILARLAHITGSHLLAIARRLRLSVRSSSGFSGASLNDGRSSASPFAARQSRSLCPAACVLVRPPSFLPTAGRRRRPPQKRGLAAFVMRPVPAQHNMVRFLLRLRRRWNFGGHGFGGQATFLAFVLSFSFVWQGQADGGACPCIYDICIKLVAGFTTLFFEISLKKH